MSEHPPLTRRLIKAGVGRAPAGPTHGISATWRRGMMHAVERIDLVLAKKLRPTATISEIREVLDALVELQRTHFPSSYEEAFRICADDLVRAQRKPGKAA